MKNKILFVIMIMLPLVNNAQTLLGTKSVDSVFVKTSDANRIRITHDGRISFAEAPLNHNPRVSMQRVGTDKHALLLTDNHNDATEFTSQLGIINYSAKTGAFIQNLVYSDLNILTGSGAGLVVKAGAIGIYRRSQVSHPTAMNYYDVVAHTEVTPESNPSSTNVHFYSGGGISEGGVIHTIFDYSAINWSITGNNGYTNRYGLYLNYTKQGTNAWGVYQTSDVVKNYFNGPSLFGSNTSNTYDKAQVTGGTKTDGFTAGIRTETGNYTATNIDHTIKVNAGTAVITLPVAGIATGKIFVIKKVSGTSGMVEVVPASGAIDEYNGSPNYSLSAQWSSVTVQFDGTNYNIIAEVVRP